MEKGYLVITVAAPASVEETTFQLFVANNQSGAERLRRRLGEIKGKHGRAFLTTGFSSTGSIPERGDKGRDFPGEFPDSGGYGRKGTT